MSTPIDITIWFLITVSLLCIGVIMYFFLRIFTALKSVAQELRWTAEAYSGRNYQQEKRDNPTSDGHSPVTVEPGWVDEGEGRA